MAGLGAIGEISIGGIGGAYMFASGAITENKDTFQGTAVNASMTVGYGNMIERRDSCSGFGEWEFKTNISLIGIKHSNEIYGQIHLPEINAYYINNVKIYGKKLKVNGG